MLRLAASAAASDDPFGGGNSGGGGAGFADFSAFGSNQVSLISQRGDRSGLVKSNLATVDQTNSS